MMRLFEPAVVKALTFLCHRPRRRRVSILSETARVVRLPVRRALSVFLVISLLATSTLAAPQTIVGVATEWQSSLAFWLRANDLPGKLTRILSGQSNKPRPQEKQEERNSRVTRLQIYPGDSTIGVNGRISFAAVAYDLNNATVGGVAITWRVQDVNGQAGAVISTNGQFEGKAPGR